MQVASLQKAVEALQEALPGKLELGDSLELPKVDNKVAERLQNELSNPSNELSNLKAENEKLRTDYDTLLESSTHVTNKLRQEVQELRSQLQAEQTRWDELRDELDDRDEICEELRGKLADREAELTAVRSELSDLKQKSAAANKDLPDATDVKQESARTSDLSDKAAKVVSFFRPLLNKKAPTNLLSKVEEILEES